MSKNDSIKAYDLENRVKTYDKDMDLMHPNRKKMIQIALEFLPFNRRDSLKALDLGIGTGLFTLEFLSKFTNSKVIGIDGAKAMIELAKTRLKYLENKIEFILGDFRNIKRIISDIRDLDVIFSSYALHHLNYEEKVEVLGILENKLKKDGWFINADIIKTHSPLIEKRIQEIRVNGIVYRAKNKDTRFINFNSTRAFLDDLERNEKDQPLSASIDLEILSKTGFKNIEILWKEYREAVFCAQKI